MRGVGKEQLIAQARTQKAALQSEIKKVEKSLELATNQADNRFYEISNLMIVISANVPSNEHFYLRGRLEKSRVILIHYVRYIESY